MDDVMVGTLGQKLGVTLGEGFCVCVCHTGSGFTHLVTALLSISAFVPTISEASRASSVGQI